MMAQGNFEACLPITLGYEGGKADNPADPGGRTNEGVTQTTYDAYRRKKGMPTRSVYLMEAAERDEIYQTGYWTPAGCENLALGLDICHFDGTVNSGLGESKRWLAAAHGSISAYCAARLTSMHSFGAWATFGKGWSARVAGIEAKALKMAGSSSTAIAAAGVQAATKSKVTSAAAHGAAVVAGASLAAAPAHPALGLFAALVAGAGAIWSAFHASTSGARAAVLAQASTTA